MTQFAKPSDGTMFPEHLPSMSYGDIVILDWNLSPALDGATISSATFISFPGDFSFTTPSISGGTITTKLSGGKCGRDYRIQGSILTSDGETRSHYCCVRVD